jgi:putative oxidoreductase
VIQAWGVMVLRLTVGAVFVAHGLPKLLPIWGASPARMATLFEAAGLQPALLLVLAVGVVELLGGAAVFVGIFTRLMALPLAIDMGVAIWKVHWPNGFFLNLSLEPGVEHGFEYALVLFGALCCLMLAGPGALSVDAYRTHAAESAAEGRARLRRSSKV